MRIHEYIRDCKATIDRRLHGILLDLQTELQGTGYFTDEVLSQLRTMCDKGKTVRGSLCILIAEMYGAKRNDGLIDIAAGIELIHTSLLIHDDIIDNDTMRRGKPTIHMQYCDQGAHNGIHQLTAFGNNMAMCVGDIGFFIAMHIVGKVSVDQRVQARILAVIGREIIKTGIAQMDDVFYGLREDDVSRADIENVYRYKTARYTFSLPFMVGAMIADQGDEEIDALVRLGESIGLVFQLRDDEMGLMSSEEEIGKSVGSDIRENKKTLIRHLLFARASDTQREQLAACFGRDDIDTQTLETVRQLYVELGVEQDIHAIMSEHTNQAYALIDTLSVTSQWRDMLRELVVYVQERRN